MLSRFIYYLADMHLALDTRGLLSATRRRKLRPHDTRQHNTPAMLYHTTMQLLQRDNQVLQYIIEFKQLKSSHIQSWVFPDTKTTNPMYRSLNRLKGLGYIAIIEDPLIGSKRLIGSNKGGGSQYIWQVGPEGWKAAGFKGKYRPAKAKHPHTLAIADLFGLFTKLEQAGYLHIESYSTEPACHFDVEGERQTFYVRPDLRVAWSWLGSRKLSSYFFEVDEGSQYQTEIREKLSRYSGAYAEADPKLWPPDERVMFVSSSERRANIVRSFLRRHDEEEQALFRVHTLESLEAALSAELSPADVSLSALHYVSHLRQYM